ncbi:MAG: hypothetical protein H7175_21770 [Burkholderiales bacterium]|nr:hypothetical protein [Anaerolineae bacterium]
MKQQSTLKMVTPPQESLRALEKAVAQRFDWRILAGGDDDHTRFVIEKKVRYYIARGLPMIALYQIIGSFQKIKSGETTLYYVVSGSPGVPFFHAAVHVSVLLIMTVLLSSFVFSPAIAGNWIGILLLGIMLVTIAAYGFYAYRNYQGHLQELNHFMEEFIQRIVTQN